MSRIIPLTKGYVTIVDDADYEWLSKFSWHVWVRPNRPGVYAKRSIRNGKPATVKMHREIINAQPGQLVDHKDGDGLNNTRANLRIATHSVNAQNSKPRKNTTSIYKGVSWFTRHKKWQVRIVVNGKDKSLGYFADEIEAALAYDEAAREGYGEFARLNFPEEAD